MLRIVYAVLAIATAVFPAAAQGAERPPQFVAISFDNCSELDRWQQLAAFLDELERGGAPARFTFFVSGTNFLPDAKRHLYRGPGQLPGAANIPFAASTEEIRRRAEYIDTLRQRGNEIASHAVGHFDGTHWSTTDWTNEFRTYEKLLNTAGLTAPQPSVVGFRAPYLGRGPALHAALKSAGFRYDASGVGEANAWPEKHDGVWRFNLASLRIAGSGRHTLSMDYNFLVAQSGVAGNPKLSGVFREQMLQTYLDYFRSSYTGNRAPVHIGHHFSPMQGGVYQQALMDFARTVCGLPEVRCVTYRELADFLEGLDRQTLVAFQRGDFPHAPQPKDLALTGSRERL